MRATRRDFDRALEQHRSEIVAHCYRMLGTLADAEDVAQEALARAWNARASFRGASTIRTWLIRIATNACLDELRARPRRTLPTREGRAATTGAPLPPALEAEHWIEPFPDDRHPLAADPEARYTAHESMGLAFVAALQHLTPRQRAVLLSRDVLGLEATEVARHLGITVSAVTSLLHRARTRLSEQDLSRTPAIEDRALLTRYVSAWISGDARALVALLRDDATFSMPPQPAWYRGRPAIAAFLATLLPSAHWRLVPTHANGSPAFAVHRGETPHAIHVLELRRGKIASIVCFLDAALVERFAPADRARRARAQ